MQDESNNQSLPTESVSDLEDAEQSLNQAWSSVAEYLKELKSEENS